MFGHSIQRHGSGIGIEGSSRLREVPGKEHDRGAVKVPELMVKSPLMSALPVLPV